MDAHLDYPFGIDRRRRTATTDKTGHVADMIRLILFTRPGERVNRPDFGCGLGDLVFEPNGIEAAAATRSLVMGALQRWLAGAIAVERVEVRADGPRLGITIEYVRLDTGALDSASFVAGGG